MKLPLAGKILKLSLERHGVPSALYNIAFSTVVLLGYRSLGVDCQYNSALPLSAYHGAHYSAATQ